MYGTVPVRRNNVNILGSGSKLGKISGSGSKNNVFGSTTLLRHSANLAFLSATQISLDSSLAIL